MKQDRNVEVMLWNRFAGSLLKTEKSWLALQEVMGRRSSRDIEMLSVEAQRFLTKGFLKSQFLVMLPRLVDYVRTIGGLKELIIPKQEDGNDGQG